MATYTINTNARREAGITAAVAIENARRAALTPPLAAVTNDQYVQAVINGAFDSYADQAESSSTDGIKAAAKAANVAADWAAATDIKRAAAIAAMSAALK